MLKLRQRQQQQRRQRQRKEVSKKKQKTLIMTMRQCGRKEEGGWKVGSVLESTKLPNSKGIEGGASRGGEFPTHVWISVCGCHRGCWSWEPQQQSIEQGSLTLPVSTSLYLSLPYSTSSYSLSLLPISRYIFICCSPCLLRSEVCNALW